MRFARPVLPDVPSDQKHHVVPARCSGKVIPRHDLALVLRVHEGCDLVGRGQQGGAAQQRRQVFPHGSWLGEMGEDEAFPLCHGGAPW